MFLDTNKTILKYHFIKHITIHFFKSNNIPIIFFIKAEKYQEQIEINRKSL